MNNNSRPKYKNLGISLGIYMFVSIIWLIYSRPVGALIVDSPFVTGIKDNITTSIGKINRVFSSYKNTDSTPMILYMPDSKNIEMYSLLPDKKILLTKFEKKKWGTWNIEGWYLAKDNMVPTQNAYLMAGGGSDWEYVLRISENENERCVFSGGNHGREKIKDLKLIDEDTNTPIELNVGEQALLYHVKIIEKSSLTSDIELTNEYADVIRDYSISSAKISLTVDFEFKKNMFMETSYVCMLPIEKKFSRCVKFNDSNIIYTTPDIGQTFSTYTNDYYLGKEKTLSVDAWGNANPNYVFNIWISNSKMVDNFNNNLKTFCWDLNKGANKIYFSKFSTTNYIDVKSGTKWHHEQGWNLTIKSIDADSLSESSQK